MATIWENDVSLSDICEPYYRIAKEFSKQIKITKKDDCILLEAPCGCEKFGHAENGGKALAIPQDKPVYNGNISVCKGCKASPEYAYCPLKLAHYIKYIENSEPEKIERERQAYHHNFLDSLTKYRVMQQAPFFFYFEELDQMALSADRLAGAKVFIDNALSIPLFSKMNNGYIKCSFGCPESLSHLFNKGNLDTEAFLSWDHNVTESFTDYSITLPADRNIAAKIIGDCLCGNAQIAKQTCSVFYILIVYTLLQSGQFLQYMVRLAAANRAMDKKLEHHFGYQVPPALKARRRFYGLLQISGTKDDETVPLGIASLLRAKCGLTLSIRKMKALDFAENFLCDIKEGHNDNPGILYKEPEPRVIHVLYGLSEFLEYIPRLKETGAVYDRAKSLRAMLSFFEEMRDNYYFLVCGNKEELDRFLKTSKSFRWLFGEERLILKDYTDKEMADKIHRRYPDAGKRKALAFLKEHRKDFPLDNEKLIGYLGNHYEKYKSFPEPENAKSASYQEALDALTGLENIKEQAKRICNLWKFMQTGKETGATFPAINTHMLFKGNPGTGKTTVARILANAMYDYGVCKERKLVEVHCPDLIAGYVGQTALKTRKKIEKALGGVLFIDEAYALTQARGSFGDESLAVLVKMMEDHRDELTVIFAGYPDEMEQFLDANPGLRSRIGYTFDFKDYTKKELVEIFETKMKDCHFTVSGDAKKKAEAIIRNEISKPHFGNGRFIDKLVQEVFMEKAQRDTFSTVIQEEDIPDAMFSSKTNHSGKTEIGFKP